MPRRIPDYPDAFEDMNDMATQGSTISFISMILFFVLMANQVRFSRYQWFSYPGWCAEITYPTFRLLRGRDTVYWYDANGIPKPRRRTY